MPTAQTLIPLAAFAGHWPAIDALLDVALALAADERAVWVESRNRERAGLRTALRRRLSAHAVAGVRGHVRFGSVSA